MESLSATYERVRGRMGHFGVIAVGIGLILVSYFIRTDIFEAILDVVGLAGILVGLGVAAIGLYMLGEEKGWWDRLKEGDRAEPRIRLISSPLLFLLVLLFLALPWMTIKCEGEDVVTVTGLEMVMLEEKVVGTPAGRDTLSPETSDAVFVYIATVTALVGAALVFIPMNRDRKRYARAALGVLGVLALVGFVAQMMLRVDSETEGLASASMEYGFYLSVVAFLAAIALQFVPMSVPPDERFDTPNAE